LNILLFPRVWRRASLRFVYLWELLQLELNQLAPLGWALALFLLPFSPLPVAKPPLFPTAFLAIPLILVAPPAFLVPQAVAIPQVFMVPLYSLFILQVHSTEAMVQAWAQPLAQGWGLVCS